LKSFIGHHNHVKKLFGTKSIEIQPVSRYASWQHFAKQKKLPKRLKIQGFFVSELYCPRLLISIGDYIMFCPFCGKQNKDNVPFCAFCGKALPLKSSAPQ